MIWLDRDAMNVWNRHVLQVLEQQRNFLAPSAQGGSSMMAMPIR
jgi:hypothetical protein